MYKLYTDTACDLPLEIIERYKINQIPIYVYSGDTEYKDKVTMMPEELYMRMAQGEFFKTAQIPPGIFEQKFRECAEQGVKCMYIGFSSGISNTFSSSQIARENVLKDYPDAEIMVYDSKLTCGMLGLAVLEVAKMIEANKSKEHILDLLDHYREHGEHIFTVDDIEYLYKGGRVSKASAYFGELLNIKPLIDIKDGKLRTIEKIRGKKKVISRIIDLVKERNDDIQNQIIAIGHSADLESMEILKERLKTELGYKQVITDYLGSAVASHTGPGILAVFFLNKKYYMN